MAVVARTKPNALVDALLVAQRAMDRLAARYPSLANEERDRLASVAARLDHAAGFDEWMEAHDRFIAAMEALAVHCAGPRPSSPDARLGYEHALAARLREVHDLHDSLERAFRHLHDAVIQELAR